MDQCGGQAGIKAVKKKLAKYLPNKNVEPVAHDSLPPGKKKKGKRK